MFLRSLTIPLAGPSLVLQILKSSLLDPLITRISSSKCPPSVTVVVLATIHTIVDNLPPAASGDWAYDRQLASLLYASEHVGLFRDLISFPAATRKSHQIRSSVLALLCKTCSEEKQKQILADAGVLEALANQLASFVVAQGFVLPSADILAQEANSPRIIPPAASSKARIAPILRAIALLVEDSPRRAKLLTSSPVITAVFPRPQAEFLPSDVKKAPWGTATYFSGTAVPRHDDSNVIDAFLPAMPATRRKLATEHAAFPPLGSGGVVSKKRHTHPVSANASDRATAIHRNEEDESPMIPWLIHRVREESGLTRLLTARLLIALFALGHTRRSRASMFCMLLVPLLIDMLDKDYEVAESGKAEDYDVLPVRLRIQQQAPALLAILVMDDQKLQKAAVECEAIKKLSQLLKETFDPLPSNARDMWSPDRVTLPEGFLVEGKGVRFERCPSLLARHTMKLREGILQALASIAPANDDFKKAMCDQGVVPYIIDSLKPYNSLANHDDSGPGLPNVVPGNAATTLLAACGAARMLTRSVRLLRTSLIDAGVGPPLFNLLRHDDVEVQIAATTVVCNLALDFSPMKEAILQHNVTQVLCEHSHSPSARLRLESLWALRHLVLQSTPEVKMKVLQGLRLEWIKDLLATDPADVPEGTVIGVDDQPPDDVSMSEGYSTEPAERRIIAGRISLSRRQWSHQMHTVDEDQEIQGVLLDLIRNFFCDPGSIEMIDTILRSIGQQEFFEIMLARIRPRTAAGPTMKDNKTSPASAEISVKVLYIIAHIAASQTRFRNMLLAQHQLLRQVLALTTSSNREVRGRCCWIVTNLTYPDDDSDKLGCRQRAQELHKMGFLPSMQALVNDPDLDVRERAKTAVDLIGAHVRES